MKRLLFTIGIAMATLLAIGCTDEEKHLLTDNYIVQGDLTPDFQVPVSSGELTLDDLLTTFGGALDGYITDDSVITFRYNLLMHDTIEVGGLINAPAPRAAAKKKPLPTKDGDVLISKDTIITYSLPIDIFDQVDFLEENDLSLGHLWFSLDAMVQGFCPDNVRDDLREYVWASIDSLAIQYDGKEGHMDRGVIPQASLRIDDLTAENRLSFDSVNLADIVNALPTNITVMFRLHLNVDEQLAVKYSTTFDDIMYFQELLDSLRMTRLVYGVDLDVNVPFEIRIGRLVYNYDINLTQSTGESAEQHSPLDKIQEALQSVLGGSTSMDSSSLSVILRVDNGIPLNFKLDGIVLDENESPLFRLLDTVIASAQTAPVPGQSDVSEAVAPSRTMMTSTLTYEQANLFLSAKTLRLAMLLTTDGTDSKRIRRTDNIKLRLWVRVSPRISVEIPINIHNTGNNGNN